AGATGVSGSSAHTVPTLLMPEQITGTKLTQLADARTLPDAKLGGIACYRIGGNLMGSPTTLWIEKVSYLLRRIDERTQFDDFRTESTTTYTPVANRGVPNAALRFDAPS